MTLQLLTALEQDQMLLRVLRKHVNNEGTGCPWDDCEERPLECGSCGLGYDLENHKVGKCEWQLSVVAVLRRIKKRKTGAKR